MTQNTEPEDRPLTAEEKLTLAGVFAAMTGVKR